MTVDQILDRIWEMPWYKVLYIAVWDDFILLVKLWPLWAVLFLITAGLLIYVLNRKDTNE